MLDNFLQTVQGMKSSIESFTSNATDTVTTEAKNTLDRLGDLAGDSEQTLNNLTSNFTKTLGGLNEATTKVKTSVLEATNGAVKTLTEASDRAANVVTETTDRATEALNDATNVSVYRINDATASISEAADRTKLALDATLHKAEQLSDAISNSIQEIISTSVQEWMVEHQSIVWVVTNPLFAIALVLLLLSLLNASIKFAPRLFLFMLKSLSIGAFNTFQSITSKNLNTQDRLPHILNRLEELRQEQDILMREVKEILTSKK